MLHGSKTRAWKTELGFVTGIFFDQKSLTSARRPQLLQIAGPESGSRGIRDQHGLENYDWPAREIRAAILIDCGLGDGGLRWVTD